MLYIVVLVLSSVFITLILKSLLSVFLAKKEASLIFLDKELKKLSQENDEIKKNNSFLEETSKHNIALYDLTRDICKTLDEEKIFRIFKEYLNREIKVGDCKFLKASTDLLEYRDYTVLPLKIDKNAQGYLVASDIQPEDTEKFFILAQQFLVGIKRSILYQKVQELTITDPLTQSFSRRYFFDRLQEEMVRSERFKQTFSFLMIDIDHFKEFNDHYGHLVGDAILREVSSTIKDNIRQIDFMGRYGGEELSIVLTDTGKEQAFYVAERIRHAIESKNIRVYDEELKVTISIGIATFPVDAVSQESIIENADNALYLAKEKGRNRGCLYHS